MHPAIKILIGALMVVVGVYSTVTFWSELVVLVKAAIGPVLILLGAFIVWLESDEWKMRKESRESTGLQQQFTAQEEQEETEEETAEEVEGYTCEECGKTFDTERGLHIHQAQKHK